MRNYRQAGAWCDVCVLPNGAIAFVRSEGPFIVCELDGVEAWRVPVPAPWLFTRCAALPDGTVAAIGKAADLNGTAMLLLHGVLLPLGPTFGNYPVCLTALHAYYQVGGSTVRKLSLDNGQAEDLTIAPTSQGLRDVLPGDGPIILSDATYAGTVNGVNFGEWQTRWPLTVGQHGYGIGVLLGSEFWTARQGSQQFGIHGAISHDRIAVCAYTELGSFYQEFSPPYPVDAPTPPPPPPPAPKPVPVPAPVPVPKPKPPVPPAAVPLKGIPVTVFLKSAGKYLGVDPSKPLSIYADRTHAGAWEAVSLVPNGDGTFIATFTAAKVVLSLQPDGSRQPRPEGTSGSYETLYATSQPDGCSLVYRVVEGCAIGVLTVVEG